MSLAQLLRDEVRTRLVSESSSGPAHTDLGTLEVVYRAETSRGPVTHWQRWHGGRLAAWEVGVPPFNGPVVSHDSEAEAAHFVTGLLRGPAACMSTRVLVATDQGESLLPSPPYHLAEAVGTDGQPRIPNASIVVQLALRDTPFGPLDYWLDFRDGALANWQWGRHHDSQVLVATTLQSIVDFHDGRMGLVELAQSSHFEATDWTHLMLVAGLFEGREYQALWQQLWNDEAGDLMAALGRLMASESFARFADLAADLVGVPSIDEGAHVG